MNRLAEARAELDRARDQREDRPPSLFDPPYLATVEANASEQWMHHAVDGIRTAARIYPFLTVDQAWPFVTEPVHDRKAMGAAMRRAARERIIERCRGEFRISERPETHGRPVAVWRSMLTEPSTNGNGTHP